MASNADNDLLLVFDHIIDNKTIFFGLRTLYFSQFCTLLIEYRKLNISPRNFFRPILHDSREF